MNKKTICIFCSASSQTEEKYQTLATQTGKLCAQNNLNIIYGGAAGGLMGLMANAALKENAHVTGVIPKCLEERERAHNGLSKLIIAKDLHERQKIMANNADLFLILPGGLGTLAEFFEILTWKQIGLHNKPILIFNAYNYWNNLLTTINDMQNQQFLHEETTNLFKILENLDELKEFLQN